MKKALIFVLFVFALSLYIASSSEEITKIITQYKTADKSILGSDQHTFGDLYGFSRISSFRKNYQDHSEIKFKKTPKNNNIDLYIECDSYLWFFGAYDSLGQELNKVQYARYNYLEKLPVHLDTSKKKILLFEFSERNISDVLNYGNGYLHDFLIPLSNNQSAQEKVSIKQRIKDFVENGVFNKNINTNIEYNFWQTSLFRPVKELKTRIDYGLFGRIDKDVCWGSDKKYLLYKPTIDTNLTTSSFKSISNSQMDTMINRLNVIYDHYKKLGFTEVYLSIIPNPVTILYPNYAGYQYNNLIPRIESDPRLKIKCVSVYNDFKNSTYQVYQNSDTHWCSNGLNLWLNKFSDTLQKY